MIFVALDARPVASLTARSRPGTFSNVAQHATLRDSPRAGSIQVLRRAALLLEELSNEGRPVPLSELSRRVNLNKSTTFNILSTLVEIGFVATTADRQYRLGPGLLRLGAAFQDSIEIRAVAQPYMVELRDLTGETVTLHVRQGEHRVCIEQVPSLQPIRRVVPLGRPRDLYLGAIGQVLMGGLSQAELTAYLAGDPFPGVTAKTITDPGKLHARVHKVLSDGYAFAGQESDPEVSSLAIPLLDSAGSIAAGLAVSGPFTRWTQDAAVAHLDSIIGVGTQISQDMGLTRIA